MVEEGGERWDDKRRGWKISEVGDEEKMER